MKLEISIEQTVLISSNIHVLLEKKKLSNQKPSYMLITNQ